MTQFSPIDRQGYDGSRDTGGAGFMSHALGLGVTRYHHILADGRRGVTQTSPSLLDAYFPLKTDGGCQASSVLFQGARFSSRGASKARDRRQVLSVLPLARGPVATFKCLPAVMAASRQFRFSEHNACKLSDALEAHLKRLSSRVGFNTVTDNERHLEPCSLNQGKRLPQ